MNQSDTAKDILRKEGYLSTEDFLQDWSLIFALSKVEQYRAEIEFFEHKYRMNFDAYAAQLRREEEQESFEKEDDLDDWEFAIHALRWWEDKIRQIKNA